jgi:pyridoxine/pyridoxamine 5'-phosphate oxidase
MAAGYGIATDPDGMVAWSWVTERLTESRSYWVCTTYADGRPHAMPVWGLWLDDSLLFSTDPDSVKARNLAARPDVVIHLESGDDVAIASGRAQRLTPDELPDGFVAAYAAKYDVELDVTDPGFGFYRLRPERILAWREGDFPTSATRFTPGE